MQNERQFHLLVDLKISEISAKFPYVHFQFVTDLENDYKSYVIDLEQSLQLLESLHYHAMGFDSIPRNKRNFYEISLPQKDHKCLEVY